MATCLPQKEMAIYCGGKAASSVMYRKIHDCLSHTWHIDRFNMSKILSSLCNTMLNPIGNISTNHLTQFNINFRKFIRNDLFSFRSHFWFEPVNKIFQYAPWQEKSLVVLVLVIVMATHDAPHRPIHFSSKKRKEGGGVIFVAPCMYGGERGEI